jgi:hypothetical protein
MKIECASINIPFALLYIKFDIPHKLISRDITIIQLLLLKIKINEATKIAIAIFIV